MQLNWELWVHSYGVSSANIYYAFGGTFSPLCLVNWWWKTYESSCIGCYNTNLLYLRSISIFPSLFILCFTCKEVPLKRGSWGTLVNVTSVFGQKWKSKDGFFQVLATVFLIERLIAVKSAFYQQILINWISLGSRKE